MDSWTKSGLAFGCLAAGLTLLNAARNYSANAITLGTARSSTLVQSAAAACYYLAVTLLLTGISLKLRGAAMDESAEPAKPAEPAMASTPPPSL